MNKVARIGVLGAGSFGTTVAQLLCESGHEVIIYSNSAKVAESINKQHINPRLSAEFKLNEKLSATTDIKKLCRERRFLFLAIPPSSVTGVLDDLKNVLEGDHVLVHTLRYLFGDNPIPLSQYIWDNTLVRKVAYLTGPVFEEELLKQNPVSLLIASPFRQIREDIMGILAVPWIRIYSHVDIDAVEWSSALANIGMLASGLASGVGFGASTISMLLSRMANEISTVLNFRGDDVRISEGMAGIGMMFAGVNNGSDFFYQWGQRMGKSKNPKKAANGLKYGDIGLSLLTKLHAWSEENDVYMPLTTAMYKIFIKSEDISLVQKWLLSRPPKSEFI